MSSQDWSSGEGLVLESELVHCHVAAAGATLSSSVRIAVNLVPTCGCLGDITTRPGSLTLVDGDRQVDVAQVIPVIVVSNNGGAVFAAGPEPHRYLVDVVTSALS